jgi:hypothetical protein
MLLLDFVLLSNRDEQSSQLRVSVAQVVGIVDQVSNAATFAALISDVVGFETLVIIQSKQEPASGYDAHQCCGY